MDSTSEELVDTLCIDVFLLMIMLLFFVPFKNTRSHPDTIGRTPAYCERTESVSVLVDRVYTANDDEIIRSCQVEGYTYLINIRHFALLVGAISVIGLALLIPIYSQGNTKVDNEMNRYAVQHILDNERYLWVVVFCWVVISAMVYGTAGYYLYKVHAVESIEHNSIQSQSVQLSKLPQTKTTEELQHRLAEFFKRRFPGCVLSIYVVPDVTEILVLQKRVDSAKESLESAEAYFDL